MRMINPSHPWLASYDDAVNWAMDLTPQPVFAMLDSTVRLYGDRPAFDFLGKKYTWAQIGDLVNRFAHGLQAMGIGPGVHVGLFLPNTPYFLIAYYGVLKTGATVVNFNPLYAERELIHQITDSETDYLVTADLNLLYGKALKMLESSRLKKLIMCRFADVLPFPQNVLFPIFKRADQARVTYSERIIGFEKLIDNPGTLKPLAVDPVNDIAVLQYTGGTTGVPKGAMLTHANIWANTHQAVAWFPGVPSGAHKMLGVLPFFHVFAMTAVMNFSVLKGLEIIALPRFDLKQALKVIHTKRPHFLPAVPAIFNAINNEPTLKKYDLSSLKYCISGGAPLPVQVKKSFEANTGCIVVEGYGLTESSPVACINPVTHENKPGSIGLPIPGTVVEIINPDDKITPVPVGERGELTIRGPQVMKGYWKKPAETAGVIRDGRLHTGDIAIMDEAGYFFIVDRLKDMIITNGYNVYPRNVEEAIYQHPAIEECIVAGLPDEQRGELVKAWIKLKPGQSLSAEALTQFLADKISKMEIPKIVEFRDKPLPKTMIGKLSRKDVLAEEKTKKS